MGGNQSSFKRSRDTPSFVVIYDNATNKISKSLLYEIPRLNNDNLLKTLGAKNLSCLKKWSGLISKLGFLVAIIKSELFETKIFTDENTYDLLKKIVSKPVLSEPCVGKLKLLMIDNLLEYYKHNTMFTVLEFLFKYIDEYYDTLIESYATISEENKLAFNVWSLYMMEVGYNLGIAIFNRPEYHASAIDALIELSNNPISGNNQNDALDVIKSYLFM